jgi:hypothetical protein
MRLGFISVAGTIEVPGLGRLKPFTFGDPCFEGRYRTPTLAKCEGKAQHLEKVGIWNPPGLLNVQSSTERGKTPRTGVFLVSLERP